VAVVICHISVILFFKLSKHTRSVGSMPDFFQILSGYALTLISSPLTEYTCRSNRKSNFF
jgi:hypothetical protein